MRTLLIVDDERNIRIGLKSMIERQFPGRYEMKCAADGEEALAVLETGKVDIMITDIRMPGLDGLTLIRHAIAISPKPEVMILSGHDDFQYAREAIKYEVKEYMLKPIVRDEMYGALERMEQILLRSEELAGRLGSADRMMSELAAAQLNYIYMHADIDPADAADRCRKAGLDAIGNGFYTGILRFAGNSRQNMLAVEFLSRQMHDAIRIHFEDKDGRLVVLTDRVDLLEGLMQHLGSRSTSAFHIGLSLQGKRLEDIRESYVQARHALGYSLLQPRSQSSLIRYDSIRGRQSEVQVPADDIRRLANMIGTDREPEMKAILMGLFDLKESANMSIGYLEALSRMLNEMVFDNVFRQYGEESVEILRLYKRVGSLYNFSDIHEYFHEAENLLFQLNDYARSVKTAHADNKEMRKAVQYIQENYTRDLNMAIVSNHVSLNYSYFSELFKEYTGQSFVTYLKTLRIAKAKELLEQTEEKVYEIGQKAGFENAKQFNRVFRELEGISASEYRAQCRARERC